MEKLNILKKYDISYYLNSEKDFARLEEIIKLMPSYAIKSTTKINYVDYFYETDDYLLKDLEASVRVRVFENKQILSIICKQETITKEFETEMVLGDKIADKLQYLLFLEDKLQDTYTHRIDADMVRLLKGLKVFMFVETNRTIFEVINNSGFNGYANFDRVCYNTKRHKHYENILKLKLNSFDGVENVAAYNHFKTELEQRVLLLPTQETKYEAGLRVFKCEY